MTTFALDLDVDAAGVVTLANRGDALFAVVNAVDPDEWSDCRAAIEDLMTGAMAPSTFDSLAADWFGLMVAVMVTAIDAPLAATIDGLARQVIDANEAARDAERDPLDGDGWPDDESDATLADAMHRHFG